MTLPAPAATFAVRWRYHFTDLRSGTILATLPMTGVSLSDVLSGAASGSGTIPLASAAVRARDPFTATVPRRCVCWAERQSIIGGQIVESAVPWAGITVSRSRALAGRAMKVGMVTWPSYLHSRLVLDHTYAQADKFAIFRQLNSDAVQQPAVPSAPALGNSPHTVPMEATGGGLSGVLADRTYLATDLKPTLEALQELATSGDGFDWRMVPYQATPGDLGSFRVRTDLGHPRLGRSPASDLRWSTDPADARSRWGFVSDLTITEDGSSVVNRVTALGSGTGPTQIRATVDGAAAGRDELAAGYPLWEGSLSSSTQDDRTYDTVYGKAVGALAAGFAGEVQVTGIKVRGDLAPFVTTYGLGDDITLQIGDTLTGSSTTIVGQLTGRTIEPAESGRTEMVTLDVQGTAVTT